MRRILISLLTAIIFSCTTLYTPNFIDIVYAQQKPTPPYAKWGLLAMNKTKEKYPNAKIVDYLHIGRLSGTLTSTEQFKLWLKQDGKEFGVFVNIEFINETEQVKKVTFKESPR